MGKWTHLICEKCWNLKNPEKRIHEMAPPPDAEDRCCFCNKPTGSAIYVRENPDKVGCEGAHVNGT